MMNQPVSMVTYSCRARPLSPIIVAWKSIQPNEGDDQPPNPEKVKVEHWHTEQKNWLRENRQQRRAEGDHGEKEQRQRPLPGQAEIAHDRFPLKAPTLQSLASSEPRITKPSFAAPRGVAKTSGSPQRL
jgi:hypothetical protein